MNEFTLFCTLKFYEHKRKSLPDLMSGNYRAHILIKEDFILNESKYVSNYEFEDENIKVTIYKEDFTKEEINFTNKLINLYEETLPKIALACVESDTFKYCYPNESTESIISKLGKPIFEKNGKYNTFNLYRAYY